MTEFDKKIKKLSRELQVPETYHEKVDEVLEKIEEKNVVVSKKKSVIKVVVVMAALCLMITGFLSFSSPDVAEASFFDTFRESIFDFLGIGEEDSQQMGIESKKEEAVSKPDLMIELQEVVMDTQNIYAVVKVTAPADVELKEGMTFDYFGFCQGANYNASKLVSGARECTLLETLREKKNVATFVVNISTDKQIKEGKEVTVFFKDLIAGPYEDTPQILVEGLWSLTFTSSYTNSEDITIKGTEDMKYSFQNTTAAIKSIKLLPSGMTVVSDVSNVPVDTLHTSDTRLTIRVKMLDGSEKTVDSPEEGEKTLVNNSSITEYEKKGKIYNKYVCQLEKAIDIRQVLGIYVEDCYVPLKNYE